MGTQSTPPTRHDVFAIERAKRRRDARRARARGIAALTPPPPTTPARPLSQRVAAVREVPRAELEHALTVAMLAGPVRALGLLKRVPALFRQRGWSIDEDVVAVACSALACVKVGAMGQRFRVPAVAREHDKWRELGASTTAADIVAVLDLGRLLEP